MLTYYFDLPVMSWPSAVAATLLGIRILTQCGDNLGSGG
jgi:hypothetical protein